MIHKEKSSFDDFSLHVKKCDKVHKRGRTWRRMMEEKRFAVEATISTEEMKRIRKKLDLTQKGFVGLLGCSKKTVERWEKEPASGPVVLLMKLLERNMDYIKEREIPSQNLPVRMWYMYKEKYCTLIDVDETKNLIQIKNYTDNVMFRAFGKRNIRIWMIIARFWNRAVFRKAETR